MRHLRRVIRQLILEDACSSLNSKVQSGIEHLQKHDLTVRWTQTPESISVQLRRPGECVGALDASKRGPDQTPCHGAYVVWGVEIERPYREVGLGALLYDVALELVGEDGLASDRESVSEDAIGTWRYFNQSNEYEKKPLDDDIGSYTDDPQDDCGGGAYEEHEPQFYANIFQDGVPPKKAYQSHPLNNVVVKKDKNYPTYRCLSDMGRIEERK